MLHHPHQRVSNTCSSTQHTSTLAVPSKCLHVKSLHHAHHRVVCGYCVGRVECSTSMVLSTCSSMLYSSFEGKQPDGGSSAPSRCALVKLIWCFGQHWALGKGCEV